MPVGNHAEQFFHKNHLAIFEQHYHIYILLPKLALNTFIPQKGVTQKLGSRKTYYKCIKKNFWF